MRRSCGASENAQVTLLGWGSTEGVIQEAIQKLADEDGIAANLLQIKWIVPLHGAAIASGAIEEQKSHHRRKQLQRAIRPLPALRNRHRRRRSHRKYDGEPFMPHHIVDGVKAILAGKTQQYVPVHEIMV